MVHESTEILLAIGRLEGKMEAFVSAQMAHAEKITVIENRVNNLEQYKAYLMGICFVLGLAGAGIIEVAKNYLTRG